MSEYITTRTDLERWVNDCGSEPPTDGAVDRVLEFIRERGFKWGYDIMSIPMSDREYATLIWEV